MWPKFLNSKWFERLFTATLSVMLLLITQRLTVIRETNNREIEEREKIKTELQSKASIPYVDIKCKELDNKIENTERKVTTHIDDLFIHTSSEIHEIRNFIFNCKIGKLRTDTTKIFNIEVDTDKQLENSIALLREKHNSLLKLDKIIIR